MLESFNMLIFIRTILEGIFIILGVHLLSDVAISQKKILLWGFILGITTFFVRMLPINFGVHTIVLVLIIILFSFKFCKIDLGKAVAYSLIFVIILFLSEGITIFMYESVFHYSSENLLSDSLIGNLLTFPSLFLAIIIAYLVALIKKVKFKRAR